MKNPLPSRLRPLLGACLVSLAFIAAGPVAAQKAVATGQSVDELGLSSQQLARTVDLLKADVAAGKIPGAVLLVVRRGKVALYEAVGKLDPTKDAPMPRDGLFRIYSMSKPITTVAAMMLVEEGKLRLDDPLSKYLPEFEKVQVGVEKPGADGKPTLEMEPAKRPITVQDLMRHTSGLTYGFFGPGLVKKAYVEAKPGEGDPSTEEFVQRLAKLPLAYQPGTTWDYSQSTDVLGRVIEVVSGKSLYQFEKERLLDPLGMKETSFYVTEEARQPRIAEPFTNDRSFGVGSEMNDPRVAKRYESGGGGMISTATDYGRFLQMMLNKGELDGKRYLGPQTVAFMTADHSDAEAGIKRGPLYLPGPGYGFGLGFAVRIAEGGAAFPSSVGEYYWGGAGGTYMWADPVLDMYVVFMLQSPKQRVYYRSLLRNMIYAAVVK